MRVLHIIPSIARSLGGPSRSSQGLVAALEARGVETWLMTFVKGERPWLKGIEHFYDDTDLDKAIARLNPEIVHLHGIWDLNLHRAVTICRRCHGPYVIAPRGMLEPWSLAQKRWKKQLAMIMYQRSDLELANALHATATSEIEHFRALGLNNFVIHSPNGVNVPDVMPLRQTLPRTRAIFMSRMHPKKGAIELVEAWARVRPRGWQCEFVYTLNGEEERKYEASVKRRAQELGLAYGESSTEGEKGDCEASLIFTGPLDDDAKWEAYARADLFVLPTYSENFGIVVAEALWAGVPVITTKGTPWAELESEKCGWWIDLPESKAKQWSALDNALREATSLPRERGLSSQLPGRKVSLADMGARGHRLIEKRYCWTAVCENIIRGYEKILAGG